MKLGVKNRHSQTQMELLESEKKVEKKNRNENWDPLIS